MKDQSKTEIKVGITVIMGVLIFLWILGWAKNFSLSSTTKELMVKFRNVAGLEVGDMVTVNGVRKGFVEEMSVEKQYVLLRLNLDDDVELKEDASFAVSMLDLMGGKKVAVQPGLSNTPIDYNKVYYGTYYADIPEVMSMLGSVQEDIVSSLKDLRITLRQVNTYLTDEALNANIKNSAKNLNEISQKMITLIDENQASIKKISSNTALLTDEAREFINTNRDGIQTSVESLQKLLAKADTLITSANKFASEIKQQENNIGKILYDEEMYKNLTNSIKQLNELSKLLLEQLKNEGINVDAHIGIF